MCVKADMKIYSEDIIFCKEIGSNPAAVDSGFEIDFLIEADLDYFSAHDCGRTDIRALLTQAGCCIVARDEGRPIHHTCIQRNPFYYDGLGAHIDVGCNEAYVYGIYTDEAYRGRRVASCVLKYIEFNLREKGVKFFFSHVWSGNRASQRLFEHNGYRRAGRLLLINFLKKDFWVVWSGRPFLKEKAVLALPFLRVYPAGTSDLKRIVQGLQAVLQDRNGLKTKVGIWGAGGHTQILLSAAPFLKSSVTHIFDNSADKQGAVFVPLGFKIEPPEDIIKDGIEIVIISSKDYEAQIARHLKDIIGFKGKMIALYPSVNVS